MGGSDVCRREEFLGSGKSFVLLSAELCGIVHTSDKGADDAERKGKHKGEGRAVAVGDREVNGSGDAGNDGGSDEGETAHGGGTLLVLMPARTDLEDGLPHFTAFEDRDQFPGDENGNPEGGEERRDVHQVVIHVFCT